VRHTPGVDNVVADALLWPPTPHPPANHFVQECHMAAVAVADPRLSQLDLKEMAMQQILCQQVQQLRLMISFKQVGDLKLCGDVSTSTFRPLVPLPHRQQIFDHLHWPAHPGLQAKHCIISSRYVWCGLARDVTAWAWECLNCQRGKVHCHMRLRPVHVTVSEWRFSHIIVDLVGLLAALEGATLYDRR
jgi:Integrase zinc binding domain